METRCCECRKGEKESAHNMQDNQIFMFDSLYPSLFKFLSTWLAVAPASRWGFSTVIYARFLFMSETCRCLRNCSASPAPSSCHQWCQIMTTSTPTTTRSLSSSSSRSSLRRCSSRPSSPPFAGRVYQFVCWLELQYRD